MSQQSSHVLTASGAKLDIDQAQDPYDPTLPVWAEEPCDRVLPAVPPSASERFSLGISENHIGTRISLSGRRDVKKYFSPFLPKRPTALEELGIVMVTADELLTADLKLREDELRSTEGRMTADPAPSRLVLLELQADAKRQTRQLETLQSYMESRRRISNVDGDEVLRMAMEQGYGLSVPATALSFAHQCPDLGKEVRLYCQHPEIEERRDHAIHYYGHVIEVRVHFKQSRASVRIMPSKSLDRVPLDLPLVFIASAA